MAPSTSSKVPQTNGYTGEHLQPPNASSTSSLTTSPSRPRSILNVSRSTALTPSLSSNTPLNQFSSSPSTSSFVGNGNGARSGIGSTTYGALNRLKRVASNASIASSSKLQHQQVAPQNSTITASSVAEEVDTGSECSQLANSHSTEVAVNSGGASQDTARDSLVLPEPPVRNDRKSSESSVTTMTKRPRSPPTNLGDTSTLKQARRKTWFGFGGYVESDGDVKMVEGEDTSKVEGKEVNENANLSILEAGPSIDSDVKKQEDTEMRDIEQKTKSQGQMNRTSNNVNRGWLSWRGPNEPSSTHEESAQATQPSYTDTVRRYISATSSQGASWIGLPGWNANDKDANESVTMDTNIREHNLPVDVKTQEEGDAFKGQTQPTASRWWPSWGTSATQSLTEIDDVKPPPTPAEQVKAEALARIEAKDAVLNNATRSTWINYFSSRSALPPSKIEDKDRGPEIMKIDFPSTSKAESSKNSRIADKEKSTIKEPPLQAPTISAKNQPSKGEKINPKADPAPPISRPSTPLTSDKERAKEITKAAAVAAAASKGKKTSSSTKLPKGPPPPNLLLPSFDDTFTTAPRSTPPSKGMLEKTLSYLFNRSGEQMSKSRIRKSSLLSIGASRSSNDEDYREQESQTRLPRLWKVINDKERAVSKGCRGMQKVTIIGIHGWFSQGPLRNLFGEPTGTSIKFATMMSNAVKHHFKEAGYPLSDEQLSMIALEADGLVADRVNKSFSALLNNTKWLSDVLSSNVVFIASHSQGSVVATHLLARLIEQRYLDPKGTKVVLLAMCGIHQGPFTHLRSSVASYYLNTFETPAAKELFEFQNSKSPVSMMYTASLRIVISAGVKLVYIASMDDQVVPLYSALNSSASHPSILRAIFCDGAVFPRVDFLTNLLSFCAAVRNAGLSDHNLLTLLSASVAGSLYGGAGHSIVYEEPQVYTLAVRYLMEVTSPNSYPTTKQSDLKLPMLSLEPFSTSDNAKWNSNPFALPWSLRGLLEDEVVRMYFEAEIEKLLHDYNEWNPTTKTLKDVQFRLEPMRLVSRQQTPSTITAPSNSKL